MLKTMPAPLPSDSDIFPENNPSILRWKPHVTPDTKPNKCELWQLCNDLGDMQSNSMLAKQ